LDIRAELPEGVSLSDLAQIQDYIGSRFAEKKEHGTVKGTFQLGPEPKASISSRGSDGYLFKCSKEGKIVQARLDGFTFNKLKAYESWQSFRSEGSELWNLYCKIAKPDFVKRIAFRYINRIEAPLPMGDFKEYLLTTPRGGSWFTTRDRPLFHEACCAQ
jgi:uncharacterized protein (TIGR04255 family)